MFPFFFVDEGIDSGPIIAQKKIRINNKSHAERTVPVIGFKNGVRVLLSNSIPSFVPNWK